MSIRTKKRIIILWQTDAELFFKNTNFLIREGDINLCRGRVFFEKFFYIIHNNRPSKKYFPHYNTADAQKSRKAVPNGTAFP